MSWSSWFATPRKDQQPVLDFIKKEQIKRGAKNGRRKTING